jgi:hypothetical protein
MDSNPLAPATTIAQGTRRLVGQDVLVALRRGGLEPGPFARRRLDALLFLFVPLRRGRRRLIRRLIVVGVGDDQRRTAAGALDAFAGPFVFGFEALAAVAEEGDGHGGPGVHAIVKSRKR